MPFRPWIALPFLAAAALLGTGPAALAQTCRVGIKHPVFIAGSSAGLVPPWSTPAEHRQAFQFRVQLDGHDASPAAFEWTVVDQDGHTPLTDAGSVQDGLYTPPALSLSRSRTVRVRAVLRGRSEVFASAPLIIRPQPVAPILDRELGGHWRGPRVDAVWHIIERKNHWELPDLLAPGTLFSAPPLDEPKDLAWAPPFRVGERVLEDRFILMDACRLMALEANGKTEILGDFRDLVWNKFRHLAVRPASADGPSPLECFMAGDYHQIGHLTGKGSFEIIEGAIPRQFGRGQDLSYHIRSIAANAQGQLFVAMVAYLNDGHYGSHPHVGLLRRWDPKAGWSTLAGNLPADSGSIDQTQKDGTGSAARLGYVTALALDDAGEKLYFLDQELARLEAPRPRLRACALATGTVGTIALPEEVAFHSPGSVLTPVSLRFRQGRLLAMDGTYHPYQHRPNRLLSIDPGSGQVQVLYQDGEDPAASMQAGPCTSQVPPKRRGRLGGEVWQFALGGHGQIGLLRHHKVGLLLLDNPGLEQPGAGSARESKAAASESKAEHKQESKEEPKG